MHSSDHNGRAAFWLLAWVRSPDVRILIEALSSSIGRGERMSDAAQQERFSLLALRVWAAPRAGLS